VFGVFHTHDLFLNIITFQFWILSGDLQQLAFFTKPLILLKTMNALLRVLIPSWRFFDDVGHVSKLFYQVDTAQKWQPCFQPQARHWYQLFLNPHTNLRLALNSLVDRLMSEISAINPQANKDQLPQSVSYQLVENLVRHQVRSLLPKAQSFRFKIVISAPGTLDADYDALISEMHEV